MASCSFVLVAGATATLLGATRVTNDAGRFAQRVRGQPVVWPKSCANSTPGFLRKGLTCAHAAALPSSWTLSHPRSYSS